MEISLISYRGWPLCS